jgi:hypothetical protein
MLWDNFKILGMFGLLGLIIQLCVFVWENWFDTSWQGLRKPVSMRQVLVEWATYMLLFIVLSVLIEGIFYMLDLSNP